MKSRIAFWLGLVVASLLPSFSAAELKQDIVFTQRDGVELKLDIALPDDAGTMRPALICVHGGGWRGGERQSYHRQMNVFSQLGLVAATVDYRLTDVAPWPAQIDDVRAAHRWLVEHANDYGIDPERIGVIGQSAGGHLSVMLGVMPEERKEDLRVRSVVNFYGPSDLREIPRIEHARGTVEALVGGRLEDHLDQLKQASPVTYVDRTDPPVLTFHGTEDELVPIWQAETLHKALTKSQIPNHLEPMQGAGHESGGDVDRNRLLLKNYLKAYLFGSTLPLVAHEDFDHGSARWKLTDDAAWKPVKKDGRSYFSLVKKVSDYQPKVRSPHNIALLHDVEVGDFVLDVDLRSTNEPYGHQSLCLFFGHQDASHFYYVHFGREADAHANSIFLVNDAPRLSIAESRTDGTDWSRGWHRARIRREVETGKIDVFFDDMQTPVMSAVDKTFTRGEVGIGSFDDMGDFDAIRLRGRVQN